EEKQFDIHVRSEGWIENLLVKSEGEIVEQGDVLFQIYSPALSTAQSEYIQAIKLNRRGLIDAARARLGALGMTPRQIEQVRQSGKSFLQVDITAPRSGTVVAHQVREGMFVKPQTLTMRLVDLKSVWVIADIFENQTTRLKPDQTVQMTVPSAPTKEWSGTVDYIYPMVEADTRTVKVRLRFDNVAGELKLNAFAKVEIDVAPIEDALTIPLSAVIRTSMQDRVILALGEGRFRPAQVHLGFESEGRIQILAGLKRGEKVVTSGQFLIDSEASLEPSLLRLASPKLPMPHDMMNKGASE
ncbi:MAG: efflux RND transporter periplasmic adaptor subunit, partial [Parvibaculaceae bacterium]|nr:efflux RND transporter periplasmic adaptor subunit [Parvibaculaceae bacterium]